MNLLWMDEDELRQACRVLLAHLAQSRVEAEVLLAGLEKAASDGYRYGYADACADRALQVSTEVKAGDATCLSLH